MPDSRLFGRTYEVLSNSLDVSAKRHNLISSNIANMDTIGYKPKDLDFKKTLKRAMTKAPPPDMARTHNKHFAGVNTNSSSLNGANSEDVDIYHLDSVNIDTEMTNLVENNIKYRTTTEMLLRKLDKLRYAIREGGR
ncbi:MAG: flagellar basal body rod protein FlgB [Desulfobacterales bacterium]|nr:flagellar basal body rod protein FlgB [Desulfobacterales bacterium]